MLECAPIRTAHSCVLSCYSASACLFSRALQRRLLLLPVSPWLCLSRRFLLVRHCSLAWTLTSPGIRMSPLSPNGKVASMTESAIGTDFDQSLDVHRGIFAKVAFDVPLALDHLTDAVNFILIQVLHLLVWIHFGRGHNARRTWIADTIDVCERDDHVFVARKIDACNACHICSLSLPLLVLRVLADHPHHATAVDDLTLIANLLY